MKKIKLILCAALGFSMTAGYATEDSKEKVDRKQAMERAKKLAKKLAEAESLKLQKMMQDMEEMKNAAKTDKEKAEFQAKVKNFISDNDQTLESLEWKRKKLFFKMLFHGIKKTADEENVLALTISSETMYSRIDLDTLQYIGGLNISAKNANETILAYEKTPDKNGIRFILYLDGHLEISSKIKY